MSLVLLLASSLAFGAKDGTLKDLDKHAGFRDLALGQRCDEVDAFKGNSAALKEADAQRTDKTPFAGLLLMRRPDDSLKVGDTPLLDVGYACYADQLMSVRLLAWGPDSAEGLLFTFTTAFGAPPKADADAGSWIWDAKDVVLRLDHDKATDAVSAVFTSKGLVQKKRTDDEERRRSAIQDL
jgi:hypothetical protein